MCVAFLAACVCVGVAAVQPRLGNHRSQPGKSGERLRLLSTRMELVMVMEELVKQRATREQKLMTVSDYDWLSPPGRGCYTLCALDFQTKRR